MIKIYLKNIKYKMKSITWLFILFNGAFFGYFDYLMPLRCKKDAIYSEKKLKAFENKPESLLAKNGPSTVYRIYDENRKRQIVVKAFEASKHNRGIGLNETYFTVNESRKYSFLNVVESGDNCYYDDNNIYIELESFVSSFREFLHSESNSLRNSMVWRIYAAITIVKNVIKLHDLGYVHRDIKPDNILVRNEIEFVLSDFASIQPIDPITISNPKPYNISNMIGGTPGYVNREIDYEYYSREIDVYALGLTVFVILTGDIEKDFGTIDIKKYILEYEESSKNIGYGIFTTYFKDLVLQMINSDYRQRPVGEILKKTFEEKTNDALKNIDTEHRIKKSNNLLDDNYSANPIQDFVTKFVEIGESKLCDTSKTFKCLKLKNYIDIIKENRLFFDGTPEIEFKSGIRSINEYIKHLKKKFRGLRINKETRVRKTKTCSFCEWIKNKIPIWSSDNNEKIRI